MAADFTAKACSLVMEIENGRDKAGNPVFKKKTYSGIKPSATADNIYNVANAIRDVLSCSVREYDLIVTNEISQRISDLDM